MTDIVAVLVVPAESDPRGLLAKGPFGELPPAVNRWVLSVGATEWERGRGDGTGEMALPIMWDGKVVKTAWDHARRRHPMGVCIPDGVFWERAEQLLLLADDLVAKGYAARVVRLARDAEGRLVEVANDAR